MHIRAVTVNRTTRDGILTYRELGNPGYRAETYTGTIYKWDSEKSHLTCINLYLYALNSAVKQLCCPSVNISHLFGKAVS